MWRKKHEPNRVYYFNRLNLDFYVTVFHMGFGILQFGEIMIPVEKLQPLADIWPSHLVCRDRIESFTGGLVTQDAIRRCEHEPPRFRFKGRKVAYFVSDVLQWLANNLEAETKKTLDQLMDEHKKNHGVSDKAIKERLKKLHKS